VTRREIIAFAATLVLAASAPLISDLDRKYNLDLTSAAVIVKRMFNEEVSRDPKKEEKRAEDGGFPLIKESH